MLRRWARDIPEQSRAIKSNQECGCCLQIKLSTKSFEPAAAEVLAQGITNVRGSLLYADLSDIIAGAGSDLWIIDNDCAFACSSKPRTAMPISACYRCRLPRSLAGKLLLSTRGCL